jgi:hypothetical protein
MKRLLLTGIAALFLATGAAHTETNVRGCFVRVYDKAHLAKHPDQIVTTVKLHIKEPDPDPDHAQPEKGYHWFTLKVKVRGRDETLHTSGICFEGALGLKCHVECDGGGVDVTPRGDHAMMYLKSIRMFTCDQDPIDGGGEDLSGGKDDRVFRLNRVNERACAKTSHEKIAAD